MFLCNLLSGGGGLGSGGRESSALPLAREAHQERDRGQAVTEHEVSASAAPLPQADGRGKNRLFIAQNLNGIPFLRFTKPPRKSASFYKYFPWNHFNFQTVRGALPCGSNFLCTDTLYVAVLIRYPMLF
jgi:hypothetical protein